MGHYDIECKNCGFKGHFRVGPVRLKGLNYALGCKKCRKIITITVGERRTEIIAEAGTKILGEKDFSISKDGKINYICSCGESEFINYGQEIKKEGKKARKTNSKMKLTCPACDKKEMIILPGPIRD
ncbi:hypothetical protein GF343_03110 [Candidatus Woesearchaeota archaeon]|nr:hypothetical protein [Candidatus Woesearchaeota archaeon]